jgi:hypothetical protein
MQTTPWRLLLPVLLALHVPMARAADGPPSEPAQGALQQEALFWAAYNACDVAAISQFFPDDVEFYHDRGGPTIGKAGLTSALQTALCGNPKSRLRREVVEGTVRLFPLSKGDATYGAIVSGEHLFYVLDAGKPARADGHARFTHLWLLQDGVWKMSRVLSYDHRPVE